MKLLRILLGIIVFGFVSLGLFALIRNNGDNSNILTLIGDGTSSGTNIINWHKTFDRHELYSAAYGNGIYVAVGSDGVIKTSTNGSSYTIADNNPIWLQSVVFGGNKFVAVGSIGTILVSTDGKQWDKANSGVTRDLKGIAWNGKLYVAIGDKGTIVTSNDGVVWTKRPLEVEYSISNIISGNGKLIACISDTFNVILESDNGVDWYTVEPIGNHYGYYNAAYNGSMFMMYAKIPNQDGFVAIISTDGRKWTEVKNAPIIRSITGNGRSFIGVGDSKKDSKGILTQKVYASENGNDWRTHEVKWDEGFFTDIRFIFWCKYLYIGLKYNGEIYTSKDALIWKQASSDISYQYEHMVWNGKQIMAYNKDGKVLQSDDGSRWVASTKNFMMAKPILNVYHLGDKTIVIAGSPATLYISINGGNWLPYIIEGLQYVKVLWSGNKFLLMTTEAIYISADAYNWTRIARPPNFSFNSIAWNGKTYVAVGGRGIVYGGEGNYSPSYRSTGISTDLVNWSIDKLQDATTLNAVIWANGQFVTVGEGGAILTSIDGLASWIPRVSGTSSDLLSVLWDGQKYIAAGERGTILYSRDGKVWTKESSNLTSDYISQIVWTGKKYIAFGWNSIIGGTSSSTASPIAVAPIMSKFFDIESHWAKEYIYELVSRNAIKGIDDMTFAPSRTITRAEFAAIIIRALGIGETARANPFSDVKDSDWFCKTMLTAYDKGIINGYGTGVIKPYKYINRQEAMVMITRAMRVEGKEINITDTEINNWLSQFTDSGMINQWAKSSAGICIRNKIVQGSNGLLRPNDNITRAETAAIILKMLQ